MFKALNDKAFCIVSFLFAFAIAFSNSSEVDAMRLCTAEFQQN